MQSKPVLQLCQYDRTPIRLIRVGRALWSSPATALTQSGAEQSEQSSEGSGAAGAGAVRSRANDIPFRCPWLTPAG